MVQNTANIRPKTMVFGGFESKPGFRLTCGLIGLVSIFSSFLAEPTLAASTVRATLPNVVNSEAASTERAPLTARRPVAALPPVSAKPQAKPPGSAKPIPSAPRLAPIAIPASEPLIAPAVRPMDVQDFQKIGAPYQANGTWYIPAHEPDYNEIGTASWYGRDFHGRNTANGEVFDMNVVTAAHPTLPIPSLVEVTNLANGRSMIVRVNDRGPFVGNRLIDLSARAAELLGYQDQGSTQVRVRYVGPADPKPLVTAATLSPPGEEKKWAQAATASSSAAAGRTQPALYVQAGAFSSRTNAQRALTQLAGVGSATIVESQNKDGMTLFRLVIGPVMNSDEARQTAQTISTFGLGGAHVMASLN
jgi:rare lipoprotein A